MDLFLQNSAIFGVIFPVSAGNIPSSEHAFLVPLSPLLSSQHINLFVVQTITDWKSVERCEKGAAECTSLHTTSTDGYKNGAKNSCLMLLFNNKHVNVCMLKSFETL